MGVGWQSALKGADGNIIPGNNIEVPDITSNNSTNSTIASIATVLALVALGLLAPEVLLAIGADAAAGADVAAGAADVAAEEPGYVTWAKSVVDNPNANEDTLYKAEEILYRNKIL